MIAADTSAWIEFFAGSETTAGRKLEAALAQGALDLPMPVLFEVLSGPGLTREAATLIRELPRLDLIAGFWERAGELRAALLKKGHKARSMDCLVAQSCLDHDVALIASDNDYRHFSRQGLKLA